jgi:hypothetical protein
MPKQAAEQIENWGVNFGRRSPASGVTFPRRITGTALTASQFEFGEPTPSCQFQSRREAASFIRCVTWFTLISNLNNTNGDHPARFWTGKWAMLVWLRGTVIVKKMKRTQGAIAATTRFCVFTTTRDRYQGPSDSPSRESTDNSTSCDFRSSFSTA